MEDELTFFMSAEELQLFLLLPPQCVDYGDGQPQCFLGVPVWSQGVHPGAGGGDVLCETEEKPDVSFPASVWSLF